MSPRRLVPGLLLICLGAVFLAEQFGWIDNPGNIIADWWPLAIILIAVVAFAENPQRWPGALVLALIGVALLANTTDTFDIDASLIWPLVLIGIGAVVLLGRDEERRRGSRSDTTEDQSGNHTLVDV